MGDNDEQFMKAALRQAAKGSGRTDPNPMVGAVIVKHGKIVGKGYHTRYGAAHAEVEAIRHASDTKGATLYVTLEPCSHFGKTPPCTDAIIQSGIRRVVVACLDPNPSVPGNGVQKLRKAGIEVSVGVLDEEANDVNEAFMTFHSLARPFVAVKFASSLDGKLATRTHDAKWITNDAARGYSRDLRAKYQAILVGVNTVLKDDPHLGTRAGGKRDPIRIILDSKLRTPLSSQVLRDDNVIIFALKDFAPPEKIAELERRGMRIICLNGKRIRIRSVLTELHSIEIISVLIEGGGDVIGSFIDDGSVDKVFAFFAPILIGGSDATYIRGDGVRSVKDALRLSAVNVKRFGDNTMLSGRIAHS